MQTIEQWLEDHSVGTTALSAAVVEIFGVNDAVDALAIRLANGRAYIARVDSPAP
ncbi:hypothetical protein [Verminephrobacter eiseniae]|uniref:hypothetical protein n=1 Tax=Verminephrobacter eiseniae TaxID=364317 RepID=UPI0022382E24|nr:hypothetical protein [Verminephrobacter eiseniae]